MKKIIILGAGTAGTSLANRIAGKLPADWSLQIVDPEPLHLYQPDLLFIAFGGNDRKSRRPRRKTLSNRLEWIREGVRRVDPEAKRVELESGDRLEYDLLVIATGTQIRPDEVEGLLGEHWYRSAFDFYTLEGAHRLRETLANFDGGRLVVNVVEMPIKCPVAPLEFLFLADAFFTRRGIRDRVELVYATPLDGAFTKPLASAALGHLLTLKGVTVEAEFNTGEVDGEGRVLRSWDEREIPYGLLVSIPTHGGAPFLAGSGLVNELDFVRTEKHSLTAKGHDDIYVLGDATDLPSSKAGSVAHFQSEVAAASLLAQVRGESPAESFDGHSNCFIETGYGKGLMIDFNYDTEPLPGTYPLPGVGPFSLLAESRRNHWGKLAFRWLYWNAILPARPLPVAPHMSMVGKRRPVEAPALGVGGVSAA